MGFVPALALGGLSGMAQYLGAKKAEHAQTRVYNAERARQQGFTNQQQALFEDSLAKTGSVADPANQQAAIDHREQPLAAVIAGGPATGAYLPGSHDAPAVVHDAMVRADAAQRGTSAHLADALARLGATGDQLQTADIASGRNAGQIEQIGSFMAGSNAAAQAETEAAARKGQTLRTLGALAQQFGMAAVTGGASAGAGAAGGAMPSGQWGQLANIFGKGVTTPAVPGWNLG